MKIFNILAACLALASGAAFADGGTWQVSPTCTRDMSKPTTSQCSATQTAAAATANKPTSTTPGISLNGVCGVTVTLSAASGQTLSGGGTVRYHKKTNALARYAENQDIVTTVTFSGGQDVQFADLTTTAQGGFLYVEARSVTSSSGALTVTVTTAACGGGSAR